MGCEEATVIAQIFLDRLIALHICTFRGDGGERLASGTRGIGAQLDVPRRVDSRGFATRRNPFARSSAPWRESKSFGAKPDASARHQTLWRENRPFDAKPNSAARGFAGRRHGGATCRSAQIARAELYPRAGSLRPATFPLAVHESCLPALWNAAPMLLHN
eukprot:4568965-Pleurochrysis_carterae.AAC.2